jgi:hypothetical protein
MVNKVTTISNVSTIEKLSKADMTDTDIQSALTIAAANLSTRWPHLHPSTELHHFPGDSQTKYNHPK